MTFEAFERMRRVLDSYRSTTDESFAEVTWSDGYEIRIALPKDLNWMKRGACCRNDDGVNWFPNPGDSADPAKAVCSLLHRPKHVPRARDRSSRTRHLGRDNRAREVADSSNPPTLELAIHALPVTLAKTEGAIGAKPLAIDRCTHIIRP